MKPLLVVVEGIDLTGKDTVAKRLAHDALVRPDLIPPAALILQEPPATDRACLPGYGYLPSVRDMLRAKVAGSRPATWSPEAWICAFMGAMLAQDWVARAALTVGRSVVYARRELSTIAYQCLLNDRTDLIPFVLSASSALAPVDVLVHLDGDPDVLARRLAEAGPRDNAAFEDRTTQHRLRTAYSAAVSIWRGSAEARGHDALVATVNAEQDLVDVVHEAEKAVRARRGT